MLFNGPVVENRPLGKGGFVLRLGGCEALSEAQPGQFVMVRGEWTRDPLLPRAFSILRTTSDGGCELLIKAVGRGSRLLELVKIGTVLSVLGPLGRRFPAPEAGRRDLLVAGGVGLAPLLWHAEQGGSSEMYYGARSADDLVLLDQIRCKTVIATEDGSRGVHGRVTAALQQRLDAGDLEGVVIMTCGPNPMMRAVVDLAKKNNVPCFVSVEGEMACGIGACLGCAVPLTDETRKYGYACVDGPVFDASKMVIP